MTRPIFTEIGLLLTPFVRHAELLVAARAGSPLGSSGVLAHSEDGKFVLGATR